MLIAIDPVFILIPLLVSLQPAVRATSPLVHVTSTHFFGYVGQKGTGKVPAAG